MRQAEAINDAGLIIKSAILFFYCMLHMHIAYLETDEFFRSEYIYSAISSYIL